MGKKSTSRQSIKGSKGTSSAEPSVAEKTSTQRKTIREAFADIDRIRKRLKPLPKGVTVKDLIEEGRI